jgi:hypothetical protein
MANTTQTFKVAGITTHGDSTKVRFTDDMVRRIKQFTKGGATRVDLVELPTAMTKVEALKYLTTHADFQSAGDQATIADSLSDRVTVVKAPKPAKAPKVAKVKVAKVVTPKVKATKADKVTVVVAKPSLDAIKARAKKAALAAADAASTETPEVA